MRRQSRAARIAALWLACLTIGVVACGQDKPPARDSDNGAPHQRGQQRPRHIVKSIIVGDARVRLDSTIDFAAIEQLMGPATTADPLNHDDSWKICYQLPHSRDAKYLIFMANEVGGANHRVLGVRLLRDEPERSMVHCSPTTARVDSVIADDGVHVGMSRDSIERLAGVAPERMDNTDDWEYHEFVETKPDDSVHHVWPNKLEIASSCIVTFLDDRATDIQLWYAELG